MGPKMAEYENVPLLEPFMGRQVLEGAPLVRECFFAAHRAPPLRAREIRPAHPRARRLLDASLCGERSLCARETSRVTRVRERAAKRVSTAVKKRARAADSRPAAKKRARAASRARLSRSLA